MSGLEKSALLPPGFADLLPPLAAHEAGLDHRLMMTLAQYGYEHVRPPLLEYEESLLSGTGAAMRGRTFRLMDPVSDRMLALRADMTTQIARIAATRLADAPRPLRLSYAGQVVRVRPSEQKPERQFAQSGIELIGSLAPEADAEIIRLAVESLCALGIADVTVDLALPTLMTSICDAHQIDAEARAAIRHALDRKDSAELARIGGPVADIAARLLLVSGPALGAMASFDAMNLPREAEADRQRLVAVYKLLGGINCPFPLTVDLTEARGFEYQTGLSFTIFARSGKDAPATELGRGGRYRVNGCAAGTGEPATGFTLYGDSLALAAPPPAAPKRLFIPHGTDPADTTPWHKQGWVTLAGLEPCPDPKSATKNLGCTHYLHNGQPVSISEET